MYKPLRRSVQEQLINWCVHFNGAGAKDPNKRCDKGHRYCTLAGPAPGWINRLPCLADNNSKIQCSDCKFPTQEQVEAEAAEIQARHDALQKAIRMCHEDSDQKGFVRRPHDMEGEIVCPRCGKMLKYMRSGYNGHVWGRCSTEDCLSWMQ